MCPHGGVGMKVMSGGVPQNKELHCCYEAECNPQSKMVKCRLGSCQVNPVSSSVSVV